MNMHISILVWGGKHVLLSNSIISNLHEHACTLRCWLPVQPPKRPQSRTSKLATTSCSSSASARVSSSLTLTGRAPCPSAMAVAATCRLMLTSTSVPGASSRRTTILTCSLAVVPCGSSLPPSRPSRGNSCMPITRCADDERIAGCSASVLNGALLSTLELMASLPLAISSKCMAPLSPSVQSARSRSSTIIERSAASGSSHTS
mmetsp:Transcript_3524/g.9401  ORF Transcript_3524/g.9401 Transcript_3524/m.9401 type:complete len:204 (-) Transcript_3524:111-722(-)